MKKILFIFGTRPEIIKLFPLIELILKNNKYKVKLCFTGQHKELAINLLKKLNIKIDYNLNVMKNNQNLSDLSSILLNKLSKIFLKEKPDLLFVQGDTTSAMIGALVGFYNKVKICHIEAGLRTYDKYSPFPEEINRKFISNIADYNFVPTKLAKENLLKENVTKNKIFLVGNTVIDACKIISSKIKPINKSSNQILITIHRRENFGKNLILILNVIKKIAYEYQNYNFIFPIHPNPNVKGNVFNILGKIDNIKLIEPLDYPEFIGLIKNSVLIMTDSGGIQEEALSFNKCVMVLRDKTERTEGFKTGKIFLTEINKDKIYNIFKTIINDKKLLLKKVKNPFGNGKSSEKIYNILKKIL